MKITNAVTMPIFVVWTNTDRTEGRGAQYPLHVTKLKETAMRLARGAGVQGCDADVIEDVAYLINGVWYMPATVMAGTDEDRAKEHARLEKEKIERAARTALDKAAKLGLTDEDIAAIVLGLEARKKGK